MDNQVLLNNQQGSKAYSNPKASSIAYICAFVFFFFAFFTCEGPTKGRGKKISGVELATGSVINSLHRSNASFSTGLFEDASPSSIWALLALVCTLVGIPASILYNKKAAIISLSVGIAGVFFLIIMPVQLYFKWHDELEDFWELINFQFGYFAVLACLVTACFFCYKRYMKVFR